MPVELGKHVRYTHPQDLVLVQALVYAKYHVRDPEVFYTARCSRDSVNTRGRQAARCGFSMPSASYRVMFKKMARLENLWVISEFPGPKEG